MLENLNQADSTESPVMAYHIFDEASRFWSNQSRNGQDLPTLAAANLKAHPADQGCSTSPDTPSYAKDTLDREKFILLYGALPAALTATALTVGTTALCMRYGNAASVILLGGATMIGTVSTIPYWGRNLAANYYDKHHMQPDNYYQQKDRTGYTNFASNLMLNLQA